MIAPDVENAEVEQPCGGIEWAFQMRYTGIWFKIHRGCAVHYWDITCLYCRGVIQQSEVPNHNCKSSLFTNEYRGQRPDGGTRALHLSNTIFPASPRLSTANTLLGSSPSEGMSFIYSPHRRNLF